ncbi:MAG: DUF6438 domain-containing protein [Bacteroidota bacterium]
MPRNTSILLSLLLLLCFACDPSFLLGPSAANADKYDLRISYHRGACYGRCEVYSLDVYENGLLLFKGERFTDRPGVWEKSIDRRRVVGLLDSFERAGFADFPRNFRSRIPDAPAIEFTYKDAAGEVFRTSFKEESTAYLEALDQAMRRLAGLPGYRQVSDDLPGNGLQPTGNSERQEVIVQLADGVNVNTWLVNYGKQNVQFKKRLSPNSPYYLLTADPNLMGAEELLDFLRQDASVVSAQLNNRVNPR